MLKCTDCLLRSCQNTESRNGLGWKEPLEVIQSIEQGHLQQDHVPQGPVEPDLESSQESPLWAACVISVSPPSF